MPDHVNSASDDRTANNAVRHTYRVLSDEEKAQMIALKDIGAAFIAKCNEVGKSRELSLAVTNAEQAVMWAVTAANSDMLGNMTVQQWQDFVNSKASGFEVEAIGYNGGQGLPFIKKKGAEEYRDLATKDYADQGRWPGVSWSDNQHETNFPVGHNVFCGSFQATSNQTFDCRTSGGNYTNGSGSRLAGTWKTRGSGTNGTLAQRVG